jgi:hypothetical protein
MTVRNMDAYSYACHAMHPRREKVEVNVGSKNTATMALVDLVCDAEQGYVRAHHW